MSALLSQPSPDDLPDKLRDIELKGSTFFENKDDDDHSTDSMHSAGQPGPMEALA